MNIVQIALAAGIIIMPVLIIRALKENKKKNAGCDGKCNSCKKSSCE